jgi:hypothetical protein
LAELDFDDAGLLGPDHFEGLGAEIQMVVLTTAVPVVWARVRHRNSDST